MVPERPTRGSPNSTRNQTVALGIMLGTAG
jgi:hypothetical protein